MRSQEGAGKTIDKKAEILRCARVLFSANGFKDTSVADITKMAGVAAGTFYLYYASKDKLFMEIYMEENIRLKRQILEMVDLDGDPFDEIRKFVGFNMSGMAANPILREWYNRDVFEKIERAFHEENGVGRVDFLYSNFLEIIRQWQAKGKMRADIDSEMIMAIFSSIVVIDLHKDEIGLQYFPAVQEYLTEFVVKGLTSPGSG